MSELHAWVCPRCKAMCAPFAFVCVACVPQAAPVTKDWRDETQPPEQVHKGAVQRVDYMDMRHAGSCPASRGAFSVCTCGYRDREGKPT